MSWTTSRETSSSGAPAQRGKPALGQAPRCKPDGSSRRGRSHPIGVMSSPPHDGSLRGSANERRDRGPSSRAFDGRLGDRGNRLPVHLDRLGLLGPPASRAARATASSATSSSACSCFRSPSSWPTSWTTVRRWRPADLATTPAACRLRPARAQRPGGSTTPPPQPPVSGTSERRRLRAKEPLMRGNCSRAGLPWRTNSNPF
jgi:hypothetical protein